MRSTQLNVCLSQTVIIISGYKATIVTLLLVPMIIFISFLVTKGLVKLMTMRLL
jgi:hypothetical protein